MGTGDSSRTVRHANKKNVQSQIHLNHVHYEQATCLLPAQRVQYQFRSDKLLVKN